MQNRNAGRLRLPARPRLKERLREWRGAVAFATGHTLMLVASLLLRIEGFLTSSLNCYSKNYHASERKFLVISAGFEPATI